MLKKKSFFEVEVVEMGEAAIDQLSSLLEADHQFLRKYLAENNCTEEFIPELHSSGVLDMMPELLKVIQIFRSIPATSCSSERSFSSLRRIKTYLRITIGQDRLSSVALINMECEYSTLYAMRIRLKLLMFLGEGVEEHSISYSRASN